MLIQFGWQTHSSTQVQVIEWNGPQHVRPRRVREGLKRTKSDKELK